MAAATATQLLHICKSPSGRRHPDRIATTGLASIFRLPSSSSRYFRVIAASSKSQKDGIKDSPPDPAAFNSQDDDVKYVLKLGAGSFVGAASIKYGSIIFPEITRPSIPQALFIISAPVILAVLLLFQKSLSKMN